MSYEPEKINKGYGSGKYRDQGYKPIRSPYKDEKTEELSHIRDPKLEYDQKRIIERVVVSNRMVPVDADEKIKSLKLASAEVIGGIFDRVEFLSGRITETRQNVALRKQIHDNILKEIEKDIDDRLAFIGLVSDINEKRNLKLDISVLRRERRHEDVQFWRDLVELNDELKKLEEEHQVEKKIAGIFEGIGHE